MASRSVRYWATSMHNSARRRRLLLVVAAAMLFLVNTTGASVIGAFVLPHGGVLLEPSTLQNASARAEAHRLRVAMKQVGRQVSQLKPDVIFLSSPHTFTSTEDYLVMLQPNASGSMSDDGDTCHMCYSASAPMASDMAQRLVGHLRQSFRDVSGLGAWGAPGESAYPFPLRWAEIIPLYFFDWRALHEHGTKLLVFSMPYRRFQAREMIGELLQLGDAIWSFLDSRPERIAIVISGDLAHTHSASGPYGYSPAAQPFDNAIGQWIGMLNATALLSTAADLQDKALSCGFTGFVALHGGIIAAMRSSRQQLDEAWSSELVAIGHPTYFGMAIGSFLPKLPAE